MVSLLPLLLMKATRKGQSRFQRKGNSIQGWEGSFWSSLQTIDQDTHAWKTVDWVLTPSWEIHEAREELGMTDSQLCSPRNSGDLIPMEL